MKKRILAFGSATAIFAQCTAFGAGFGGYIIGDTNGVLPFRASATDHYLVLSGGGVVSAFGDNSHGQCGTDSTSSADTPFEIRFDTDARIVDVQAGADFSLALDEDGTVWGWGNNDRNQLGLSEKTSFSSPQPLSLSETITAIAAGDDFSLLLTETGKLLLSGGNEEVSFSELTLPDGKEFRHISARRDNIVASDSEHGFYQWKYTESLPTPVTIEQFELHTLSAGANFAVLVGSENEKYQVYAYGNNDFYQLGTGDPEPQSEPVKHSFLEDVDAKHIHVTTGDTFTVIDCYDTLSSTKTVQEFYFGTNCGYTYDISEGIYLEDTASSPTQNPYMEHVVLAAGNEKNLAYRTNDSIELYDSESIPREIPIIESEYTDYLLPSEFQKIRSIRLKTNFIRMDQNAFEDDKNGYAHWEYIDPHNFRAHPSVLEDGIETNTANIIHLSRAITGEERIFGTFAAPVYRLDTGNESFRLESDPIKHGSEDGAKITLSCYDRNLPLALPTADRIFFEDPGEICRKTELGLYLFGFPTGTTAKAESVEANRLTIELSENSDCDLDYDLDLEVRYVYDVSNPNRTGTIESLLNPSEAFLHVASRQVPGVIKSLKNSKEQMTAKYSLTKGKENGKTIQLTINGGEFSANLDPTHWSIEGEKGLSVASVKRERKNRAILTLSGNSSDVYKNGTIRIVCTGDEYSDSRVFDESTGTYQNTPLTSENITLTKQSSGTSGGNLGTTSSSGFTYSTAIAVSMKKNAASVRYMSASKNHFRPDEAITRYEVLTALNELFDITAPVSTSNLTDIDSAYRTLVQKFINAKLISGYPDHTFRGNAGITRAEFVKLLSDIQKKNDPSKTTEFTDISSHWAKSFIEQFAALGYIHGYPDHTFRPDQTITRAEAVCILNQIVGRSVQTSETSYTDVPASHWAYLQILEAAQ